MLRPILIAILVCCSSLLFSQTYYERYTSLDSALANPDNVFSLDLVHQDLTSLPEEIGTLKNLRWLRVNFNRLESIPESIGNCTLLEELYLNDNLLTSLPASFCQLKNLNTLTLDNNHLTSLPACITGFDKITYFSIRHNPLKSWPSQIGAMKFSFSDSTWNNDSTKVAFIGTSHGVYLDADSFYTLRQVILLCNVKSGEVDTLVRSSGHADEPRQTLYEFNDMVFSPNGKFLYFKSLNAWEKSDALHRVNLRTKKEEFVVDVLGEYFFISSGEHRGNLFVDRYHYTGEGTGTWSCVISPKGKEIKVLKDEESLELRQQR